jgi:hypothetical protein
MKTVFGFACYLNKSFNCAIDAIKLIIFKCCVPGKYCSYDTRDASRLHLLLKTLLSSSGAMMIVTVVVVMVISCGWSFHVVGAVSKQ